MRDCIVGEAGGETFPMKKVTSKPTKPPSGSGWWLVEFKAGGLYLMEDTGKEYFIGGNVGGWWVTREGYLWVDDTGRPWDYV